MAIFDFEIMNHDTDIYGLASPAALLRYGSNAISYQAAEEGLLPEMIYEGLGAVWMLARLSLKQYEPIYLGDKLNVKASGRSLDGAAFLRRIEFFNEGRLAAWSGMSAIAVHMDDRRIIRPKQLEEFWKDIAPPPEVSQGLTKISIPNGGLEPLGSARVRYSDCDLNGHLNSTKYADFICEVLPYWSRGPSIFDELRIDFSAEVKPETAIHYYGTTLETGGWFMRGQTRDGQSCFTSTCTIRKLQE